MATVPTIFETRVASGADDIEEKSSGSVKVASSDLDLVVDGSTVQLIGIRFTDIDIPQGAIITSAYLQFQADEVSTGAASLLIRGQDSDDALAFTGVRFDASARPLTDAAVAWSPADWTVRGEAGVNQRTSDLSAIIQEIVNRSGWAALNDMAFVVSGSGTRIAEAYEGSATGAPLLHIEWLPASAPVVFGDPPDRDAAANQIGELAAAGTLVGITASAADPDPGASVTYSIDDARFAIDAATGVVTRSAIGTLDHESEPAVTVTVTATSSDGSRADAAFTVAVGDEPEAVAFNNPPDADGAANRITATAGSGTAVGITASADDPDAGDTVSYSLDDARFAIDPTTGVVTRSGSGTLDAEAEPSISLAVTATSSDGSVATQNYAVSVTGAPPPAPAVFETRVASSADDVEERSSGSVTMTSSDLELTFDGSRQQTVGIRFTDIDIPQGAIITSAYIQFTVDEVDTGTASLLIRGEDSDDAAAFTTANFNASSRPVTDAAVAWSPTDWTVRGEAGLAQRTPELSTVVQEIVDRSGWEALNDLVFLVTGTGTRTARAYDSRPGAAPLLHIEYFVPSDGQGSPVAFNAPADADAAADQVGELAVAGTLVGITASAADPDPGASVTYSIDDARFAIDAATGVVTRSAIGTLDHESEPAVTVTVTATSSDGSRADAAFTVAVGNEPEAVAFNDPPDADGAANRITATAGSGTAVGITASADDSDAGDTVSYSLDDTRFAVDPATGVVTRSGSGTLDADAEPSINLTVIATSSDGSSAEQAFTVNVAPEEPQTLFQFAVFGDFGDTELSGERAVAELVNSWNVDFILTVGDNVYAPQTLDTAVGQFYSDYISPYNGAYGDGSLINRFFPTLGNHEYDEGNVTTYFNYFTLPDHERYYDFQAGSVHFFALNSNSQEPDGNSASSTQGQWLQTALGASDAMFNITYFHHTPYTPSGGDSDMRWPFEQWGVDAVFAGHKHDYSRVMRDDNGDGIALPYTTTGLGGAGNSPPNVGANLVTVSDAGLLIEFYTVDGVLQDSHFLDAPAGGNPLFVNGHDVMNGTAGADYLWGLGGNDTLIGGPGDDMLIGGDDDDLFVFSIGDGQDVIADFVPGAGTDDVLDLRAFGIDSAASFQQVAVNQGSDVLVDLGGGDLITLTGVQVAQFHDGDFRSDLLLA